MRLVVPNMVSPSDVGASADTLVVSFQDLKRLALRGALFARIARYETVEMLIPSLDTHGRLLPTALLLRYLSHGPVVIRDATGREQRVTVRYIGVLAARFARDLFAQRALRRRSLAALDVSDTARPVLDLTRSPLYLRTDAVYGVASGGSVGHIAGVLNNLRAFGGVPVFVTTDPIPTVDPKIPVRILSTSPRFRDFPEMWIVACSEVQAEQIPRIVRAGGTSFIYQRYSLSNAAGLTTARRLGVPFVVEFNGSEAWVARHWGRPLKHEAFALAIEIAVLKGADLIVVVSRPLRDELVARGIDSAKILVNPNGVDPDVYSPDVDGSAVRERYGLGDATVLGFIGTFGRWHGAEVLAEAFGRLLDARPEMRDRLRLMMIGDGVTMPEVREAIARHGAQDAVVLTGLVPQEQGPAHLAACDILVSPHVPNPDGTPFFGSPTKLFEYMAMAKPIVASDLDQIGEVLEHDRTAWLVKPGDAAALAEGLSAVIDDAALRLRLGPAAREAVVSRYTWREHTRRIIEALKERCR